MSQTFGIQGKMTPFPCWVQDKFLTAISNLLPLFLVISWLYTVAMITKDIVYEKEKRLKEFMRVMGLSNGIHWLAWFITSFIMMFLVLFILVLVIKCGKITPYSDFSVLIVFFCCFAISTITECFLFSVFFKKANIAAVLAGMLYFVLFLPYSLMVQYADELTIFYKFLACLSPSVAFGYGCDIIARFELQTEGSTWKNFYQNPYIERDSFSMNDVCLILLMDACIYMAIAWYIEALFPGEYGVPRRWFFPLQPKFWLSDKYFRKLFRNNKKRRHGQMSNKFKSNILLSKILETFFGIVSKHELVKKVEDELESDEYKQSLRYKFLKDSIEPIDSNGEHMEAGIEINKMHKVYKRGKNHALKGLSVKFYKNEISAFLGHNGAGKSTTMHLLTGLYKPTYGDAKINGK